MFSRRGIEIGIIGIGDPGCRMSNDTAHIQADINIAQDIFGLKMFMLSSRAMKKEETFASLFTHADALHQCFDPLFAYHVKV